MLHRCLPLLALAIALASSPGVNAAEWVAEPVVNLREEYNDNIRMTELDHSSVWGTTLDPRVKLSRRSELWDLSGNARLRASKYAGEDGLDTTDSFLDIAAKRQFERGSWQASASQVNDTTLQNEELDLDTGLTYTQVGRTTRSVHIAGEYLFTEATWLEASIDYSNLGYDQGETYGLLDYDYLTPGLRTVHQLDLQTQIFAIVNRSKVSYETDTDLESNTDSLQLGASYDITETWKVKGSVGSRRTNTSSMVPTGVPRPGLEDFYPYIYDIVYVPRDSESTGLVYNATLTRKLETGEFSIDASRAITPSSTGTDTDTTSIDLNGMYMLDAKLSASLAVSYLQSATVGGTSTQADNDRFRISPGIHRRLDRDWNLSAGYTYGRTEYKNRSTNNNASSNAVYINLGYAWPRISVSR